MELIVFFPNVNEVQLNPIKSTTEKMSNLIGALTKSVRLSIREMEKKSRTFFQAIVRKKTILMPADRR